jgi:hypothetical protein
MDGLEDKIRATPSAGRTGPWISEGSSTSYYGEQEGSRRWAREYHMSQSDQFSWNMERDPVLRSTIVCVLILDTDPEWLRLVRTIDRGTRIVPRLRDRLVTVPFGLAPPRWAPAPDFDLSWHLRRSALPEPASLAAVLEFARSETMTAFDPVRPLWRLTSLSGLDGAGCALVLTVHHSLTDGIGGIRIATELLDFDRAGLPDRTVTRSRLPLFATARTTCSTGPSTTSRASTRRAHSSSWPAPAATNPAVPRACRCYWCPPTHPVS